MNYADPVSSLTGGTKRLLTYANEASRNRNPASFFALVSSRARLWFDGTQTRAICQLDSNYP